MPIQLPPDSTGKLIETVVVTSSENREVMILGSTTLAYAPVTSSAGLLASLSSGTVTLSSVHTVTATAATNPWSSAPSFNVPVVSVSSGLIQLSSQITVTATAATNPWSSAPGFNVPTVSVSSGLSQVSAIQVSPTSSVAGAGLVVITSSFGLVTQSTQPITITSGTVTLSSVHTVTATAATNPWSSAPSFNIPVVSVSSGLVQISGTPLVNVVGTSSGVAVVTTSGGLVVQATGPFGTVTVLSVSSGLVQLTVPTLISIATTAAAPVGVLVTSSGGPVFSAGVNTAAGYGPVTSSAGRLSSLSSGTVTLSSVHTVTATAGTNPWSSAPGFNVPVVSVSSGLVQISGVPLVIVTTSAFSGVGIVTSAMAPISVTSSFGVMVNQTTASIPSVINATSASPTPVIITSSGAITPTTVVASTISKVSSGIGALYYFQGFTTASVGAVIRLYNATTSNVTMNSNVVAYLLSGAQSTVATQPMFDAVFGPRPFNFGTACSFDVVLTVSSTLVVAANTYCTFQFV